LVELVGIRRGKMHCHKRGVRPVKKSRRKTVVLCYRKPVPAGISLYDIAVSVFHEVAQEVALKLMKWPPQADQRGNEGIL
jgi:hypothetical protein